MYAIRQQARLGLKSLQNAQLYSCNKPSFFQVAGFKSSSRLAVNVGDKIPLVALTLEKPGNLFDLAEEVKTGKSLIVGVPGAFSSACSEAHVPGYLSKWTEFQQKGFGKLFFVSVNDAFVIDAWSKTFKNASGDVKFLADPEAKFVGALDLKFDATPFFGNERSRRFALVVDNGTVTNVFVEPDNTPVNVSSAENVFESI